MRACGRPQGSSGCASVISSTSCLSYSRICGRVIGYQFGTPDGFKGGSINDAYIDGVSITRGSPRQHVWTLIDLWNLHARCPCAGGIALVGSIFGDDYYCESGSPLAGTYDTSVVHTDDPLWDGHGCTSFESGCCANPDPPWFHKELSSCTTDYIELRICGGEDTVNEDTPVSLYEIYVQ